MKETFISSLSSSMKLSAAVAATGVVIALFGVEHVRRRSPDQEPARDVGAAAAAQGPLPTQPAR